MDEDAPNKRNKLFSLKELSVKSLAPIVEKKVYENNSTQIDLIASQQLLAYFLRDTCNAEQMNKFTKAMTSSLNLTDLKITHEKINKETCDKIFGFKNLSSLELGSLASWTMFHLDQSLFADVPLVDVIEALRNILCEESRIQLQSLAITNDPVTFRTGWMCEMKGILPALTTLNLEKMPISESEFDVICESLSLLESFYVSKIGNLTGISNLKNLQDFHSIDSQFKGPEDVIDIFKLKNLKKLDFRGEQCVHLPCVRLYLDCAMSLFSLEFFNCMKNAISAEDVNLLATSHPQLKRIFVLDTRLQDVSQLETSNDQLHLISKGSLWQCLESLKLLDIRTQSELMNDVCVEIIGYLSNYEAYSKTVIFDCFGVLTQILRGELKFFIGKQIHANVLKCLELLCRGGRIEMFNKLTKLNFIDLLLETITWFNGRSDSVVWNIHSSSWNILHDISTSTLPEKSREFLFCQGIELLENAEHVLIAPKSCLDLMTKYLESRTEQLEDFLIYSKLVRKVAGNVADLAKLKFTPLFIATCNFLGTLHNICAVGRTEMTKFIINSIMYAFNVFLSADWLTQAYGFRIVESMLFYTDRETVKIVFIKHLKGLFLTLTQNEDKECATGPVISLCFTAFHLVERTYTMNELRTAENIAQISNLLQLLKHNKSIEYVDVMADFNSKLTSPMLLAWTKFMTTS
ncbi:Protein CBG14615 [Caenorhabditis briggsae]|uniref:Uncharacterized protein n=2 Tax=Caenorhabditis briggsae TaxID=6238 RepID=A0AAE8ZMU0_CAEBR|nr:Protein CBG14615 [Caenorhabditis briggsae]ULT82329.1 hypothetical protein L3Y34_011945 [Caenorhabditis briggsae]CAP33081.2 Protein CBG14615 [Caenorhabditis briggsae]